MPLERCDSWASSFLAHRASIQHALPLAVLDCADQVSHCEDPSRVFAVDDESHPLAAQQRRLPNSTTTSQEGVIGPHMQCLSQIHLLEVECRRGCDEGSQRARRSFKMHCTRGCLHSDRHPDYGSLCMLDHNKQLPPGFILVKIELAKFFPRIEPRGLSIFDIFGTKRQSRLEKLPRERRCRPEC